MKNFLKFLGILTSLCIITGLVAACSDGNSGEINDSSAIDGTSVVSPSGGGADKDESSENELSENSKNTSSEDETTSGSSSVESSEDTISVPSEEESLTEESSTGESSEYQPAYKPTEIEKQLGVNVEYISKKSLEKISSYNKCSDNTGNENIIISFEKDIKLFMVYSVKWENQGDTPTPKVEKSLYEKYNYLGNELFVIEKTALQDGALTNLIISFTDENRRSKSFCIIKTETSGLSLYEVDYLNESEREIIDPEGRYFTIIHHNCVFDLNARTIRMSSSDNAGNSYYTKVFFNKDGGVDRVERGDETENNEPNIQYYNCEMKEGKLIKVTCEYFTAEYIYDSQGKLVEIKYTPGEQMNNKHSFYRFTFEYDQKGGRAVKTEVRSDLTLYLEPNINYVLYNEPLTDGYYSKYKDSDLIQFNYPAGHMCFYEITAEEFKLYNIYTLIWLPNDLASIFDAEHYEYYRCEY